MQTITLYKYHRDGGGVDISPKKPDDREYVILYRLIADDGMYLKDGKGNKTYCIDTDTPESFTEETDPTTEDYEAALNRLGVET